MQILGAQGYTHVVLRQRRPAHRDSAIVFGPGGDAAAAVVAKTLGGLPTRPDAGGAAEHGARRARLRLRGPGAVVTQPSGDSADAAPPPPAQPPITADGIPCVN